MATSTGLRQRQKQQTRQLIFEAASRLFAKRGFDAVTVAEVARAAGVSALRRFAAQWSTAAASLPPPSTPS